MTNVYLVIGSQGQWEDHWTWVEAVFDDHKAAKAFKRWAEEQDDKEFAQCEADDEAFYDPKSYRIERRTVNPEYGVDDDEIHSID